MNIKKAKFFETPSTKSSRMSSVTKLSCLVIALSFTISCQQKIDSDNVSKADVVLVGGGIMSATLGSLLTELDPSLHIVAFERLDQVALESSSAWNNAGTGHAAFSELNYTPEVNGVIDIKKAVDINGSFELSKQYWAHLVSVGKLHNPKSFINTVPHMSFVWGDANTAYLKKRFTILTKHPFFNGMKYSEDPEQIRAWAPLIMDGRDPKQKIAATRMEGGTDVNFGELTKQLFAAMTSSGKNALHLGHEITDLKKNQDGTWNVFVRDLKEGKNKVVVAKFVFVGAGGQAISLLQKSDIEEAKGYGGFPIGGAWLVTEKPELINQHLAKVYGQAGVGSPPMSVPHLDTRYIDGKRALLFGPFGTFSTKFLKTGSWVDLFASLTFSNFVPVVEVGLKNLNLVTYLAGQVLMTTSQRLDSLKEYFPNAKLEDWRFEYAGQRVQVIKKDPEKGGVLMFGTELVGAKDGTIIGLLGASPGASTAVKAMITVMERSFKTRMASSEWKAKLQQMIPSLGKINDSEERLKAVREHSAKILQIVPSGFLMPDITP